MSLPSVTPPRTPSAEATEATAQPAGQVVTVTDQQALYAALDAACVPLPRPCGVNLDVLCELADRALGDAEDLEARWDGIYAWAAERGVRVTT